MIARDIAFMGYNGGAGTQFFKEWSDVGSTVRDATGTRPSLLAALAFHHENREKFCFGVALFFPSLIKNTISRIKRRRVHSGPHVHHRRVFQEFHPQQPRHSA